MSLLMDIQTNRCWARVDFLATGEIALHIPEECELPIRVLVSRGGRSTEYEPNCSEKPNNSTISKMEQVDEPKTQMKTQNSNLTFEKDECAKEYEELGLKELKELINADRKTEPMKTADYCDICKQDRCKDCIADATNPYCVPSHYEIKQTEPQIERSE